MLIDEYERGVGSKRSELFVRLKGAIDHANAKSPPSPRTNHLLLWSGDALIVWAGLTGEVAAFDGGLLRLTAQR